MGGHKIVGFQFVGSGPGLNKFQGVRLGEESRHKNDA
jgi:hypothetical protein